MPLNTCPVHLGEVKPVKLISDLCYCFGVSRGDPYCDIVCPTIDTFYGCYCNNVNYGGDRCDTKVCRRMGLIYCMTERPQICTKNVDLVHQNEIKECPCVNGYTEIGGHCKCYQDYYGLFCDKYIPPPSTQFTTSPHTTSLAYSYIGSSYGFSPTTIWFGSIVGAIIFLIICCVCFQKRNRSPGAYSGPPISVTQATQPLCPTAPSATMNIGENVSPQHHLTSPYGIVPSAPTDNATQYASSSTRETLDPLLPTYEEAIRSPRMSY